MEIENKPAKRYDETLEDALTRYLFDNGFAISKPLIKAICYFIEELYEEKL